MFLAHSAVFSEETATRKTVQVFTQEAQRTTLTLHTRAGRLSDPSKDLCFNEEPFKATGSRKEHSYHRHLLRPRLVRLDRQYPRLRRIHHLPPRHSLLMEQENHRRCQFVKENHVQINSVYRTWEI